MARWYVIEAQRQVDVLRQRLGAVGYTMPTDSAVDVELIAEAYLDCSVFRCPALTDRAALTQLQQSWGLNYELDNTADRRLAAALYVTADGSRAVFLEATDKPVRQRFSLAHELGHLVLEAEAGLAPEPDLLSPDHGTPDHGRNVGLRKYGRCPAAAIGGNPAAENDPSPQGAPGDVKAERSKRDARRSDTATKHPIGDVEAQAEPYISAPTSAGGMKRASSKDVREWRANFFAAELLMPYAGVRRLVQRVSGSIGFRTDTELERFVLLLAETYAVSPASARLRLIKDLKILPRNREPNHDFFG
jgi:hypothetical protein